MDNAGHAYKYPRNYAEVNANQWQPVDAERATWLLECLPPRAWKDNAFAVGEALCHLWDTGEVVYDMVCKVDGQSYTKPYPLMSFSPARFTDEIRAQLEQVKA